VKRQVFLSYSRSDQNVALQLAKDLKDLGHDVWFDQDLTGGQAWWDQILARIRTADLFVFVLSSDSLASIACQREYGYAAELLRPVVPVLVSTGLSMNVLPPALSKVQFIDFRERQVEAIIALSRALHSLPVGVPLPDPLPAPPEVPLSYLATLSEQIETPSVLTFEEQSRLVVELKRGLRDPATFQVSRELLGRLRARRDLLAAIAEEIDEVVAREPARGRVKYRTNTRPRMAPSSKAHASSLSGTSRTKPIVFSGFIPKLLSRTPSDPSKLRRVAEQWIWAHWLLWLLPGLVFWMATANGWHQLGAGSRDLMIEASPAPTLFLLLIAGMLSSYFLMNPNPSIAFFLSWWPVMVLSAILTRIHGGDPGPQMLLICGMFSGFLSQRIIQSSRKKLAALH